MTQRLTRPRPPLSRLFGVALSLTPLVAALLPNTSAHAQDRSIDRVAYQMATAKLDWAMREFHKATGMPGLSFSLGYGADVVLSKGYGQANIDAKIPASAATGFRLSDTGTLITASAIMMLAEQGKIKLDEDIRTYVPAFPKKRFPMTVRQVMAHTAGLTYFDYNDFDRGKTHVESLTKALEQFSQRPLKYAPGSDYGYSAFGYVLLGLAIEKASGKKYDDFIRTEVAKPFGLTGLYFDNKDDKPATETGFYNRYQNSQSKAAVRDFSYVKPAAGINGTPADLVKLLAEFWRGNVIPPLSFARMLALMPLPASASADLPFDVGLGWRLDRDYHDDLVFYMHGMDVGTTAAYMSDPKYGLHIAYTGNARVNTNPRQTLQSLLMPMKSLLAHRAVGTTISPATLPAPLACPVGSYEYRGTYDSEFSKGNMMVLQSGDMCTAVIETPDKLTSYFMDEGAPIPANLSMILLTTESDQMVFGVITPLGIFPMTVTLTDQKLKGEMTIEDRSASWTISATPKK